MPHLQLQQSNFLQIPERQYIYRCPNYSKITEFSKIVYAMPFKYLKTLTTYAKTLLPFQSTAKEPASFFYFSGAEFCTACTHGSPPSN